MEDYEPNSPWHYQDKEDIYDSFDDWSYHRFACLMKDNTVEIFGGMYDETFDGIINKHIDCYNASYDVDDIVCWIEFPRTENTK